MKYFIRIILITFFLCNSAAAQEKKKDFKRFTVSISAGKLFRQFDDINMIYHVPLHNWNFSYQYWYYAKYEDPGYYEGSVSYGFSRKDRILIGVTSLRKDIYGTVEVWPYKIHFDRFLLKGYFAGYERTLLTWKSFGLMARATGGYYHSEKHDKYKYYGDGAAVSASTFGTDYSVKLQWNCTWKYLKNSAWYVSGGYRKLDFGTYTGRYNNRNVWLVAMYEEFPPYNGDWVLQYMNGHLQYLFDINDYTYRDLEIDYSGYHLDFGVSYSF